MNNRAEVRHMIKVYAIINLLIGGLVVLAGVTLMVPVS